MPKQPVIKINHGKDFDFILALHINDLVSIEKNQQKVFYRIQLLDSANKRISLRLHTASTIKNNDESLSDRDSTIESLMKSVLQKHSVNAIGKLIV